MTQTNPFGSPFDGPQTISLEWDDEPSEAGLERRIESLRRNARRCIDVLEERVEPDPVIEDDHVRVTHRLWFILDQIDEALGVKNAA